jgi:signal transduction histidine kinase
MEKLEWAVVFVRVSVVASCIVLFGSMPQLIELPQLFWPCIAFAAAYSIVVLVRARHFRSRRLQWALTAADASATLVCIAATGASRSLAVAIVPLLVITVVQRFGARVGAVSLLTLGAVYAAIGLIVGRPAITLTDRVAHVVWFESFGAMTGVLTSALTRMALHETRDRQRLQQLAADESLRRARDALIANEREDTVRAVLHDLASPVASMRALTDRLRALRGGNGDDAGSRIIDLLQQNAAYLADVCDALRQSTQGTAPLASFRPTAHQRVQLRELVEAAATRSAIEPRVHVTLTPEDVVVGADPVVLTRIIRNLVDNALRHNPATAPSVTVTAQVACGRLSVCVHDNGPGLSPEEARTAMQRGARPDETIDGHGLGLWIVDRLVSQCGGALELVAPPTGGLAAQFEVPITVLSPFAAGETLTGGASLPE